MNRSIYDAWVRFSESDEKNANEFRGEVESYHLDDKGQVHRDKFQADRISVSGKYGIHLRLSPYDRSRQYVGITLGRKQAAWLMAALEGAMTDYDAWKAKKDMMSSEKARKARERRACNATRHAVTPAKEMPK